MNKIVILLALMLTGCETVPVKPVYPEVPVELMQQCQDLKLLEGDVTTLSKLMETVAYNYALYHQCSEQNSALIEWHKRQAEILNSVK
jgi:hypothetical protein